MEDCRRTDHRKFAGGMIDRDVDDGRVVFIHDAEQTLCAKLCTEKEHT